MNLAIFACTEQAEELRLVSLTSQHGEVRAVQEFVNQLPNS